MQIDVNDFKSVNAWVRKAKEEGWKQPRGIAEAAKLLPDGFPSSFGYCDVCEHAVADLEAIAFDRDRFGLFDKSDSRLVGARDGFVNFDEATCYECLHKKDSHE